MVNSSDRCVCSCCLGRRPQGGRGGAELEPELRLQSAPSNHLCAARALLATSNPRQMVGSASSWRRTRTNVPWAEIEVMSRQLIISLALRACRRRDLYFCSLWTVGISCNAQIFPLSLYMYASQQRKYNCTFPRYNRLIRIKKLFAVIKFTHLNLKSTSKIKLSKTPEAPAHE